MFDVSQQSESLTDLPRQRVLPPEELRDFDLNTRKPPSTCQISKQEDGLFGQPLG